MGQLLGFVYAFFLLLSFFGKNAKSILLYQTISFFFKGLHYFLLGGASGFLISFVSGVRNLIFVKIKTNKYVTIMFIIIYIIIGIFTFNSFFSIFPVIATIIYTAVINFNRVLYLKLGMLITSMAWLIYNIYIISYSGIIVQVILIISNIIALLLDKKK